MSCEWLEMQREAERHAAIEQYLRSKLATGHTDPSMYSPTSTQMMLAREDPSYRIPSSTLMPLTQADKIRMTFQDLDANKDGVVDPEEFSKGVRTCKLDFTEDTLDNLFKKAKRGSDGNLTESEWYSFVINYPMFLDALYHRFRSIHNADRDAEAAKGAKERFGDRVDALKKEIDTAKSELGDTEGKVASGDSEHDEAVEKQKDAERQHKDAVEGVADAFKQRKETEVKIAMEWEATRAQRIAVAEAARDADIAQRRLAAAEEKEKWALQALESAKLEKEQATADLESAKSRQTDVKTGEDPEAVLSNADRTVADAQRREYELGIAASQAADKADRLRWTKDEQIRLKNSHEARLNRATDALTEAEKSYEENDARLKDAENVKDNGPIVDEKENQLVEEEIRLKREREALEQKETNLHKECSEFTQRVSPQRERISHQSPGGYSSPIHNSPYTTPVKDTRSY